VGLFALAQLAFFGPSDAAPIWFRLWVDPDGLVRRAEMRAAGHFMDQRYDHFDVPLAIEAPSQTRLTRRPAALVTVLI